MNRHESAARREAKSTLQRTAACARTCTACELHANRTKSVFGIGDPQARLMFVGEGPGPEEDRVGEPFTGRSGDLLTRIIEAMQLRRAETFLTNVVVCRLDDSRRLTKTHTEACRHYLESQIETVRPAIIVPLGSTAWMWFAPNDKRKISDVRDRIYRWRDQLLVPTYHPAFLLRKPQHKRDLWKDMKKVMRLLTDKPADTDEIVRIHDTGARETAEPEPMSLFT